MDVCLSHSTALEFLRGSGSSFHAQIRKRGFVGHSPFMTRGIDGHYIDDLRRWGVRSTPIHAFVSEEGYRSKSSMIQSHVWRGPYPQDAFVQIERGLYACSPELLFLCMGQELDVVELAELGFELCGWYSLPSDPHDEAFGLVERPPLSSTEAIARFLRQNTSFPGSKRAMRAAKYLLDGSASPMESKMSLVCILPRVLGGYALPKPSLNHRISLKDGRSFYIDAFWPEANIGLEYDSRQFHTGTDRNIRDSQRRNALADHKIEIISVTPPELKNPRAFDGIARRVANALGMRARSRVRNYAERRDTLWGALLGGESKTKSPDRPLTGATRAQYR